MIITVAQLITTALQDIGAIAKSETPTADEMQDALMKLNAMIDLWSLRPLMVLGTIMESFPLTVDQYFYTIGIGGDFDTSRPSAINTVFIRDGYNDDTGVDIVGVDMWSALPDKAVSTGRPELLYYDPGVTQQAVQTGVIYLYPAPDASTPYTLFIGEQKSLTEFSAITDHVTFQPGYLECLEYNLAVRLWPQYNDDGRAIRSDLKTFAKEAMRVLETTNSKQLRSTIEVQGKVRGGYNITTGEYI